MLKISTPHLHTLSKDLEKNNLIIAKKWIEQEKVKSVFKAKSISSSKFKDSYALEIFQYFIDVVKGEQPIGDCPVMSKLIYYFLKKGITPREVFDVCMGLREVIVDFLVIKEEVLKEIALYLNEVNQVFDSNLSGVLEIFTDVYVQSQKNLEIAKAQRSKLQQTSKIMNFIDTKLMIVQNGRIVLANKPLLDVLNIDNLKSLYLKYPTGFEFFNEVTLYENEFKQDIKIWLEKVCESKQTFRINLFDSKRKRCIYFLGKVSHIPAEKTQYIITLRDVTQEVKNEEVLRNSLAHDELTGFKNYPTFERFITTMLKKSKDSKTRLFLAVADIVELREINEKYSRDIGDKVISEVAEDLRFFSDKDIYLARLEGSRFGILLEYPTEQESYDWCVKLLRKMNERKERKSLAITEVDLSESVNKLFLRAYSLLEVCNSLEDSDVCTDFKEIIKYKELPKQKEFITKISSLKTIKTTLFYRGLAVSSDSEIFSLNEDNIDIKLSQRQLKVSKIDMEIYFNLGNLGNIKATINKLDNDKRIATLKQFRFDKHSPLNRQKFRVLTSNDIKAYISENEREFDVKILDINEECVVVKIDRKRNFDINSFVYIDMLLPTTENKIESCSSEATIIRIEKLEDGYKMVLLSHFDEENGKRISQYISKVQMEIIRMF